MKYMRMMPQGLQVPEITYVKDGKKIVIQGAIHIGSRKFYEKVVDRIKGFDGETHLEGIVSTHDENTVNVNKELLNSIYDTMAAVSNLSYQKEFINRKLVDNKKVFNHDVEDEGVSDKVFDEKIMSALREMKIETISSLSHPFVLNIGSSPLFNILMSGMGNKSLSEELEETILHKRNEYAMSKALEADNNVFLFWGAKHIEGMNEILLNNGYEVERIKWLTVIPSFRFKKDHSQRKERIVNNLLDAKDYIFMSENP